MLKKQWERESKGIVVFKESNPPSGKKPWKKIPVMPKKDVLGAKIAAVIEEFPTLNAMKARLADLENEVDDAKKNHEVRLAEKEKALKENIKYYGSRVQELIQELVRRQPYD